MLEQQEERKANLELVGSAGIRCKKATSEIPSKREPEKRCDLVVVFQRQVRGTDLVIRL